MAAVPVETTAPMPAVDVLWLCGTELIAVVPVVRPPVPATVPAVAAPPTAALLPPDVLLLLPLDPPLVAVVAVVGAAPVGFVLVSVVLLAPVVAVVEGFGSVLDVVDPPSFGRVTAPVPTWPPPNVPGVEPPTAAPVPPVVVLPTACAIADAERASHTKAARTGITFMPRQRGPCRRVPHRDWPWRSASDRVAVAQTGV
jgi:hypothetical protein